MNHSGAALDTDEATCGRTDAPGIAAACERLFRLHDQPLAPPFELVRTAAAPAASSRRRVEPMNTRNYVHWYGQT